MLNAESSLSSRPIINLNDKNIQNDSTANPNISVNSNDIVKLNHPQEYSKDQIVTHFLKACFGTDKHEMSNMAIQLQTMFRDDSGLFQIDERVIYLIRFLVRYFEGCLVEKRYTQCTVKLRSLKLRYYDLRCCLLKLRFIIICPFRHEFHCHFYVGK